MEKNHSFGSSVVVIFRFGLAQDFLCFRNLLPYCQCIKWIWQLISIYCTHLHNYLLLKFIQQYIFQIPNPSKLRVDLRFYGDLIISGIFQFKEALPLLGNLLTMLTTSDREEHNNISIILSFCKHCGEDYAGEL